MLEAQEDVEVLTLLVAAGFCSSGGNKRYYKTG
jgi:hypothetical protein